MIISIIGMVICCLVAVAGIYYLVKKKKKIKSHAKSTVLLPQWVLLCS